MKVAIIYQSSEGHTREIADRIAGIHAEAGGTVDVFSIEDAPSSLLGYATVTIGGSIHLGRHGKALESYVKQRAGDLSTVTSAFFSVSLTASDAAEASQAETNRYVYDFLEATGWNPDLVGIFGGGLLYTRYGFVKRKLMQVIAKSRGLPTDTKQDYDYTDWEAVDHFAKDVSYLAEAGGQSQPAWD